MIVADVEIDPDRVLVVEDDPAIRDSLIEILEDHGYKPEAAFNGKHALDKLEKMAKLPCLIVLDLMMPIMDGRDFRKAQLGSPRFSNIPVVVLSAYRDLTEYLGEMKVGAFLKKPLDLKELLQAVETHCATTAA